MRHKRMSIQHTQKTSIYQKRILYRPLSTNLLNQWFSKNCFIIVFQNDYVEKYSVTYVHMTKYVIRD